MHESSRTSPGPLAPPELEALELTRRFSDELTIPVEDCRPCVAVIYYGGVGSERDPYATLLALELGVAGASEDCIERALHDFNGRLARKLTPAELRKYLRRVQSGRYTRHHACNHRLLVPFCVGPACPWRSRRTKPIRANLLTTFFALGWPAHLRDPYAVLLFLGLSDLCQIKGAGLGNSFTVNFMRIGERTGLKGDRIRERLGVLQRHGLIRFEIGNAWGSGTRKATKVSITYPIPEPERQSRCGIVGHDDGQSRCGTSDSPGAGPSSKDPSSNRARASPPLSLQEHDRSPSGSTRTKSKRGGSR